MFSPWGREPCKLRWVRQKLNAAKEQAHIDNRIVEGSKAKIKNKHVILRREVFCTGLLLPDAVVNVGLELEVIIRNSQLRLQFIASSLDLLLWHLNIYTQNNLFCPQNSQNIFADLIPVSLGHSK